jgi:hypothetical protein
MLRAHGAPRSARASSALGPCAACVERVVSWNAGAHGKDWRRVAWCDSSRSCCVLAAALCRCTGKLRGRWVPVGQCTWQTRCLARSAHATPLRSERRHYSDAELLVSVHGARRPEQPEVGGSQVAETLRAVNIVQTAAAKATGPVYAELCMLGGSMHTCACAIAVVHLECSCCSAPGVSWHDRAWHHV